MAQPTHPNDLYKRLCVACDTAKKLHQAAHQVEHAMSADGSTHHTPGAAETHKATPLSPQRVGQHPPAGRD
jgi:hypothetical protein